ncbi:MAG: PDZ domain-containing protein [Planctomycetota bacterium]|nr:PDZ domain-containing protein [Planctomycetota bacterium]
MLSKFASGQDLPTCRRIGYLLLAGLCWSVLFSPASVAFTPASEPENPEIRFAPGRRNFQTNAHPFEERLDQWRGSSLGMSLVGVLPGRLTIDKVRQGLAAERAGLQRGDRILQIGPLDLTRQGKEQLKELLAELPPASRLEIRIARRANPEQQSTESEQDRTRLVEKKFELVTDSKAMLDAWLVAERLGKNRVIREHLASLGESDKLEGLKNELLQAVRNAPTPRLAHEAINAGIDQLGVSHTALIPGWGYARLTNRQQGGIGLTLQRISQQQKQKYFVVDMEPGGPAFESEIRVGDEVLAVNGVSLERSARLVLAGEEQHHQLFLVTSQPDEEIRLEVRKTAAGKTVAVSMQSDPNLTANSASRASLKVLPFEGKKFGYYRIWNLMSMKTNTFLADALQNEFSDCDGLILDLRGRGGSIPVVQRVEKTVIQSGLPVACIIDRHSRSAKEILAIRLKGNPNVRLIGQTTCGAVTAATFAGLPSGNALMFPVTSGSKLSRYTRGINLEGKGVTPDETIDFSLPYLNGKQPLLDSAKKTLQRMISSKNGTR